MDTDRRSDFATFGELLHHHRQAAGLSQEELAERAGLSRRGISDLERGVRTHPYRETLKLLIEALGLQGEERRAFLDSGRDGAAPTRGSEPFAYGPLPVPPNPLIGRAEEVATAKALLRDPSVRLLTLTGAGGSGKTRLAIDVASELRSEFPDGVVFVDLAPLADPALVPGAIAATLGVREQPGKPLIQSLGKALTGRRLLLVLDNFEHLLPAAMVARDLLVAAQNLTIVATSRARLALAAEQELPVLPLAIPDPSHLPSLDHLRQAASVRLFVTRARTLEPNFALTAENAPVVAEICRRLDGLPLAIELAAARIKLLPPATLLARIERALPLLVGGARDLPTRQQTLRATIAWSYDLLDEGEQRLLRRLSVFVGGWTLEAAETVANSEATGDVLQGMVSLIDKSLVARMDRSVGESRFTMLETIREFGLEQLAATDEERLVRDAHVAWVVNLSEQVWSEVLGRNQVQWLTRLEDEHPNLRAALAWLERIGDATTRLRIGTAVMPFWQIRGHRREGRAWLERALADGDNAPSSLRTRAMFAVSALALGQADYPAALAFAEASLEEADRIGDTWSIAAARFSLGMVPQMQGDYPLAVARLEEALALWRQIDDPVWVGMSLTQLGDALFGLPDLDQAAALHEEALVVLREIGGPWHMSLTLACLGNVVLEQGDIASAEGLLRESLMFARAIDDRWFVGDTLASLAIAAERQGQSQRAARLIGVVDAVCARNQVPLSQIPVQIARYEHTIATVRDQLGNEAFATARSAGRAMPLAEAIGAAMVASSAADDPILAGPSSE